jgi:hypothetical protein
MTSAGDATVAALRCRRRAVHCRKQMICQVQNDLLVFFIGHPAKALFVEYQI